MGIYKFDFENLSQEEMKKPEILNYIHHVLFEVIIEEGSLVCKNCGKQYEIKNGIPNMVLNDDEV